MIIDSISEVVLISELRSRQSEKLKFIDCNKDPCPFLDTSSIKLNIY